MKNNNLTFRLIKDNELGLAYQIHSEVVNYMLNKGIQQWLRPIPFSKLETRQKKNENFGLFYYNELFVFLSLLKRTDYHEWEGYIEEPMTIWITTVSTNIRYKGKSYGKTAILKAIEYLEKHGFKELYLDCVIGEGFLVEYYQALGFKFIDNQNVKYRSGVFNVALMKKVLQ